MCFIGCAKEKMGATPANASGKEKEARTSHASQATTHPSQYAMQVEVASTRPIEGLPFDGGRVCSEPGDSQADGRA